ncbi:MAG TPA: nucleotidyltransferase domain-containing protein [Pricia sp.]|nr:nucleotidyltransferase domain-containing protein [Pricia sp.]
MKFGLKNSVIDKISSVFEQYDGIEKVMVYGSRAMGNYRNGSDIDLTIQGSLTQRNFYDILHGLDDLNLPYMIDLSQMENINNPDLIDHINRRGKNFYERSKVLH